MVGFGGVVLSVYAVRPVLSVSSLNTSDLHGANGAKLSITNSGMKIRNVKVQCVVNKVLFKNIHTLEMDRFAVVNEYAVPDVATGEAFTADCGFAWSMWTKPTDGFLLFGGGAAGVPQLGIPFLLNNGNPSFAPNASIPVILKPDFVGYSYNQVTGVDGSFVLAYTWPISWIRHEHVIHMIARRTTEELSWRVAPNSEPVIPDAQPGKDGIKFTATGTPGKWGIELAGGSEGPQQPGR